MHNFAFFYMEFHLLQSIYCMAISQPLPSCYDMNCVLGSSTWHN